MSEYRDFCNKFCSGTMIQSLSDHKYLEPYLSVLKVETSIFEDGVFVCEPSGIFRPITNIEQGVVTFSKLPLSRQKVYAVYDGYRSVYAEFNGLYVIFPNVSLTPYGYKFLNDVISMYPISATNPLDEKILFRMKTSLSSLSSVKSMSEFSDDTMNDDEVNNFLNNEETAANNYYASMYNNMDNESSSDDNY